jgi:hypothetical protein
VSANDNIFNISNQILYPLVQGCETKDAKVPVHQSYSLTREAREPTGKIRA